VRALLDTHALIWSLEGGRRLSAGARAFVKDAANEVLVSAVSGWEIAIKKAMGRLEAPDNLLAVIEDAGFIRRPLGFEEAALLVHLPRHHSDPFDRMLIAQALHDGIPIVTCDEHIARYQVQIVW
jgi:PIN domain nuclease of toxin-antitoxin system